MIREGEKTNAAFVIVSGAVKYQPTGTPEGTWKILTEGAMIGEYALLAGRPSQVTFIAAEHLQAVTEFVRAKVRKTRCVTGFLEECFWVE